MLFVEKITCFLEHKISVTVPFYIIVQVKPTQRDGVRIHLKT